MNAITKHTGTALALSEGELVAVLGNSLYPGASPESIKLVIGYCRAAGLDPMQKPVHIVPMWDAKNKKMRDVVMPGVNLYRTMASRTGQFAGMSEPEFGPDRTENVGNVEVTFPEWCRVTVQRALASGVVAEFTAREFWIENYAAKGGHEKSTAPNAMWMKRPRGQIAKCAAAQALRIAFPDVAAPPTAEEMEGKALTDDAVDVPAPVPPELLQSARTAADGGVAAYQAFWAGADRNARQVLLPEHSGLKARAEKADRERTVENKPVPAAEGVEIADLSGAPVLDDDFVAAMDRADAENRNAVG